MKRSNKILMTTMLTGAVFALSACQTEQNQAMNFSGAAQCYAERPDDVGFSEWADICDQAEENATEAHEAEAPRYAASGDDGDDLCEEVHGDNQCYQMTDSDGNSWFVPLMAGYFISSMINNNGNRTYGYSDSRPLYRTTSGGYTNGTFSYNTNRMNGVQPVRGNPTSYTAPSTPRTYSNTAAVRSSGGFGSSSTAGRSTSFGG